MDPVLQTAFAKSLEFVLAQALDYDPGSRSALAALADKTLAIVITQPAFNLQLTFSAASVQVSARSGSAADCTLSGSLPAVLGLLWRESHSLAGSGVSVIGDVGLLQKLQQVLTNAELDWEQAMIDRLAHLTGATNASLLVHPVAQLLRGGNQWFKSQAQKAPDWLRDYLAEELGVLPSAQELEVFYQDVDELRARTERLEAQLRKLRTHDPRGFR
jgi:ubiquinone biosynthesis protein UbiJ